MTLPMFEDEPVTTSTMKIVKTGDGLSAALRLQPIPLSIGADVYVVIKGHVSTVAHVEKDDVLQRQHTVTTDQVTLVDRDQVADMLLEAANRADRARQLAGQTSMDDDDEQGDDDGDDDA